MVALLVVLALALLAIWTALTFLCSWRVFRALTDGDDRRLILVLFIVTGGTGFGVLTTIGAIWAAWIMVSAPFRVLGLAK